MELTQAERDRLHSETFERDQSILQKVAGSELIVALNKAQEPYNGVAITTQMKYHFEHALNDALKAWKKHARHQSFSGPDFTFQVLYKKDGIDLRFTKELAAVIQGTLDASRYPIHSFNRSGPTELGGWVAPITSIVHARAGRLFASKPNNDG